ncbi:MAG: hypothetical protein JO128_04575 [Alphaproteobacteria bacterium]|nr:hypothetical protein [Alphaproteobacteria bacterium]
MWRGMNVSFRDMLFLLVFAYLVISAVALAHVAKKNEASAKNQMAPPGHVIVELTWDHAADADVDLWVQGPGDVPVGYSNKSGMIFNLVRDDLGRSGDPNSMNYEIAYGRGHWGGEYVVNAMLYRTRDHKLPVNATVKLSLEADSGGTQQVLRSDVTLGFEGQETTVFRFKLDDHGIFQPDSVNRLHKPLRAAGMSAAQSKS